MSFIKIFLPYKDRHNTGEEHVLPFGLYICLLYVPMKVFHSPLPVTGPDIHAICLALNKLPLNRKWSLSCHSTVARELGLGWLSNPYTSHEGHGSLWIYTDQARQRGISLSCHNCCGTRSRYFSLLPHSIDRIFTCLLQQSRHVVN
jgi:hypothetical protein